jgi:hypothetical protein
MATGVLDVPSPTAGSRRGTIALLSLAAFVAVVFVAAAAMPYFLSSSFGPPEYAPRRGWLLLHIAGGIIALLTGPVQLWLGLADRGMAWHRKMGVGYMTGVGVGSIGAFYMATHTDFGWLFGAGLFGLGVAWVTTTGLAFLAIKRSLVTELVIQGRKILAVRPIEGARSLTFVTAPSRATEARRHGDS